jgi:pimeloyl-ACP methyl ester carboxylesterase
MKERRSESPRLPLDGTDALCGTLSYTGAVGGAAVVFVHGFGSTRGGEKAAALEAACARRGWAFASFDFRGHGESGGTLLELRASGMQEDLDRVRGYMAERGAARLFLVGSSMGGWASAWFARRHRDAVVACAFIAPAFNFLAGRWSRLGEVERKAWRETGRLRVRNAWLDVEIGPGLMEETDQYRAERLAAGWCTPLLIFHGMRDETVSYTDSLDFMQQTTYPAIELHLIKDGEHRLLPYKDEMAEAICRFFAPRWPGADG